MGFHIASAVALRTLLSYVAPKNLALLVPRAPTGPRC